uniref:DUF547 domain-containing protein n=1 Tax=Desulfovibrio sp. U5L TaxID=596152 RepID=I2Q0C2_9BACT
MVRNPVFGLALCLVLLTAASGRAGDPAALYADLLRAAVTDGRVDYKALKAREGQLDAFLAAQAAADPSVLDRNGQIAFYINLYNAATLKLVLTRYPGIRSIKDAGSLFTSPWKQPFIRLAGRVVSLDDIEHGILRPRFHDPRVHFAVNCASKSCPPLAAVPYAGPTLDAALDAAARNFINDPRNTSFSDGTLRVSRIFDWYAADFGGEAGVWDFLRRHADPDLARRMDAATSRRLAYAAYDWSLNGQ